MVAFVFTFMWARLAQLVEHQTFNLRVKGSSPLSGEQLFWSVFYTYNNYMVLGTVLIVVVFLHFSCEPC